MTMTVIWTGMAAAAVVCGILTGRGAEVSAAAVEGAAAAVQLGISMAGMLCLWSGVMEVMRQSGLAEKLSRMLGPVLRLLFPQERTDRAVMDSISANVSANLLGLGNAATPLGIEAVRRMERKSPGTAPHPRGGRGQPVHAGGVQHRLHPAHPHHRGGGAGGGGVLYAL